MKVAVVTLFPEMFGALVDYGVSGRAVRNGLLEIRCFNPRDYTADRHQTVDDRPYGGGPGMVMRPEPLGAAIAEARAWTQGARVLYLSPQGRVLRHDGVMEMAGAARDLILIAGRYEGIDERIVALEVDEEWSIGDYVLSGGELPAMVLLDALIRQLPGALGDADSAQQDSFVAGLLDCPHYTRPPEYRGLGVPEVLLSGDHGAIERWRRQQAQARTAARRPDLLAGP
ncbi:MAG: tRNA (guanosine(37)-N1)-methyltransferase TrmD [Gammaproteobacteria bacterium]